jgi:hypothetical protein
MLTVRFSALRAEKRQVVTLSRLVQLAFLPSAERYFPFMVCGFSALRAENRTKKIDKYHAAAGAFGQKRGPQRKSCY